jgi:palmitoyltransferase
VELIDPDPQLAATPVNDNISLLHWASINNRIEIAKYLISKGAKVDAIGGALQATPLHWATRDGKLDMIILLLSYNAQPSLIDSEGKLIMI